MSLLAENLISISQAAKLFPARRGDRRVCGSTIWRWIKTGIKLPSGDVLRLDAVRIGHGWATSREALERFIGAQTDAAMTHHGIPTPTAPRTPGQRARASERAGKRLEALGI